MNDNNVTNVNENSDLDRLRDRIETAIQDHINQYPDTTVCDLIGVLEVTKARHVKMMLQVNDL